MTKEYLDVPLDFGVVVQVLAEQCDVEFDHGCEVNCGDWLSSLLLLLDLLVSCSSSRRPSRRASITDPPILLAHDDIAHVLEDVELVVVVERFVILVVIVLEGLVEGFVRNRVVLQHDFVEDLLK